MIALDRGATILAVVAVLLLLWNVVVAAQAARVRRAPPVLSFLTAFTGLLLAPAVLVAAVGPYALLGRTLHVLTWLWPLVAGLAAVQAVAVLVRGSTARAVSAPIAAFDLLVLLLALARWRVAAGGDPTALGAALLAAQAAVFAPLLGSAALEGGYALLIPVLAPLFPARWGIGRVVRPAVATGAAMLVVLVLGVALPRAARAAGGFARLDRAVPITRADTPLLRGVRIFGPLTGPPASLAVTRDLALLDTLGADVASLVVQPEGATLAALDSLARVLAPYRTDSIPLVVAVTLGTAPDAAARWRASPDEYRAERLRLLDRVVRALRPDVVFPAPPPYAVRADLPADVPLDWWASYLGEAAAATRRLRPRTLVGIGIGDFSARDSALYAWATAPETPLDLVSLAAFPTLDGAAGLEARLTTAERWLARPGAAQVPHWVTAGGFPYVFGEESQRRALRGALAWASRTPAVSAIIVADAADYDRLTGLRTSGGRLRRAVEELRREREP